MPIEIVVVAESANDARIVSGLCDRVILEFGPEWLRENPDVLPAERNYRGIETGSPFLQWSRVPKLAAKRGQRIRAFAWGRNRGMVDCATTRKALALIILKGGSSLPDFVILSRDTDNETGRWESWKLVRDEGNHPFGILLAAQHPKIEAWLLNGFVPHGKGENESIKEVRETLGLDPTSNAERLTAQGIKGKKNAKVILSRLTSDDHERKDQCWQTSPLSHLKSKGAKTGLAEYLDAIEKLVLPRFGGSRRGRSTQY